MLQTDHSTDTDEYCVNDCAAHPSFPGVYSRVSYYSNWAISTICQLSSAPPLEYDCANVMAPSQENSVPITVIIQFDDHPGEISWSMGLAGSDSILVNVTEELDTVARSRSQETVFLAPGSNVTFTIRDRYGDGLCCTTPVSKNQNGCRAGFRSYCKTFNDIHLIFVTITNVYTYLG